MFPLKMHLFLLVWICVSLSVCEKEGEKEEGERERRKSVCVYKDCVGDHGVQKSLSAPLGLEL